MHYSNLVIIEAPEDGVISTEYVDAAVQRAMGPSEESGGFWDWYQIGGRWTGAFDDYDPEKDPANQEIAPSRVKWPTDWTRHLGDVMPIENMTAEILAKFYRVVTPYGQHFEAKRYLPWKPVGEMFPDQEMPPLDWLQTNYAGHLVVVVDNHS